MVIGSSNERVKGKRGVVHSLHNASCVRLNDTQCGVPSGIVQTCGRIDPSLSLRVSNAVGPSLRMHERLIRIETAVHQ